MLCIQEESIAIIHGLIEAEVASGIPANRIVLGGFSQVVTLFLENKELEC